MCGTSPGLPHERLIPIQARLNSRGHPPGKKCGAVLSRNRTGLRDCGHFAYLDSPEQVRQALDDFFAGT
jgi:hypothetical protein